jgi:hypothetical protein
LAFLGRSHKSEAERILLQLLLRHNEDIGRAIFYPTKWTSTDAMPSYKKKVGLPAWGLYDLLPDNEEKLLATLRAPTKEAAAEDFMKWGPKYNWYGESGSPTEIRQIDEGM